MLLLLLLPEVLLLLLLPEVLRLLMFLTDVPFDH